MEGTPVPGYPHGNAAATEATDLALARVREPQAMILVEGVSDQIAVDTLAAHRGRDLIAERIAVVPIGGAQAIGRFVREHVRVPVVALCDAAEHDLFARVLSADCVFTCQADLEDELIRALGADAVARVLAAAGDLRRFTTLSKQPAWLGRPTAEQLRRFIGAGARRKSQYARLLVDAAANSGCVAAPLDAVLSRAALSRAAPGARSVPME